MKKLLYIWGVLISMLWYGCDKEKALTPSNLDNNLFTVSDQWTNPVDSMRYILYQKYGVPVFYNDTLYVDERTDYFGNTYIHCDTLKIFYDPTEGAGGSFVRLEKEQIKELMPVLEMLDKVVMPKLTKEMRIASIFLVDTLRLAKTGIGEGELTPQYRGFDTWVLGNLGDFTKLTQEELKEAGLNMLIDLVKSKSEKEMIDKFEEVAESFKVSFSPGGKPFTFYSQALNVNDLVYGFPNGINLAEVYVGYSLDVYGLGWYPVKDTDLEKYDLPEDLCLEMYGLLQPFDETSTDTEKGLWYIPTDEQDIMHYCTAVLEYKYSDFLEKYANYPIVLEKYEYIKSIFESYGFSFE